MNRRSFLKRTGLGAGAFLLAGSGALGWRAHQAGLIAPDAGPFEPWKALETAQPDDPYVLAAAAILASNPHNTQPWKIAVDETRFVLQADTDRHLGAFDPFRREMWLGLGCAIANAEIAASEYGWKTSKPHIETLGNGGGTISLDLSQQISKADPLFFALPKRRTNRAAYRTDSIPGDLIASISKSAGKTDGAKISLFARTSHEGAAFSEATIRATEAINVDQEMSYDGHRWFRGTARKVATLRDGVSVPTAGLSPLVTMTGQMMPEPDAQASGEYWLESTKRQVAANAGFGVILVEDLYDRGGQIAAGRLWQRLHLAFTLHGLAAQPMNQIPELVDRDRQLGVDRGWAKTIEAITGSNERTTFAFRFGLPTKQVPRSARRPIEWVSTSA